MNPQQNGPAVSPIPIPSSDTQVSWTKLHERELFEYQIISARINEADAKMWQVPGLTMTAQAFLLTITLSADFKMGAHIVGAGMGALIAWMSYQLMSKHRHFHQLDTAMLRHLEERIGLSSISIYGWPPQVVEPSTTWLVRRRSVSVWKRGIAVIGIVNILLIPAFAFTPWF
ncbi:hypothetical protein HQO83_03075 [Rhodococcus fascians]|nr:hypothetical protein [Rhodococcus fascians]